VGLIRLDSGFCTKEVLDYLEQRQMQYIIAARFFTSYSKTDRQETSMVMCG